MIMVGGKVCVHDGKREKEGVVVYTNDSFFTLQFKHYKESFLWIDNNYYEVKEEHAS